MSRKSYRDNFSSMVVNNRLSSQIYALRTHRGWTQKDLSKEANMLQARISKLENDCEAVNLKTLHRLANAFDVALVVKFIPFTELAHEVTHSTTDREIVSFEEDSPFRKTANIFLNGSSAPNYSTRIVSSENTIIPNNTVNTPQKEKFYAI